VLQSSPANRLFDSSTLSQYVEIPKRFSFNSQSMIASASEMVIFTNAVTSASLYDSVLVQSYQCSQISMGF
jgi:hypothetical protein